MLAIGTAVVAFLCANYYFTPPIHQFTIEEHENVLALIVFLVVAGVVSAFVDAAARRARDAARARADAETLARLAANVQQDDPLADLVVFVRSSFGLDGASVLARTDGQWHIEAAAGPRPPASPEDADLTLAARRRRRARAGRRPAHRRRPAGAQRVRGAAHRRAGTGPAVGGGRAGDRAHPGQRVAYRVAASGLARPPHAARVDQGVGVELAPNRHRVVEGGRSRVPPDDRGGDRPAHRARVEPARHEPFASGRAATRRCGP